MRNNVLCSALNIENARKHIEKGRTSMIVNELNNQNSKVIKICFVAPSAYPLLAGKNPKNVIGPDVHQVILAQELIKHDFKITFITNNEGEAPIEYINGIEVIKIQQDGCRLRILNIVLKVFRIWNAMRKAKANIYFHHGGGTGVVLPFCLMMKKKFVFHIGSDGLVNRKLINRDIKEFSRSKFSLDTIGNWLDIRLANATIIQNEYQREMLKKNFGKEGFLIKKPFPLKEQEITEKSKPPIVLWVGAMAEVKQPELFVKLAEAIPEARFQMIGGHSGNQELYDMIKESAKKSNNFEYLDVIPFDEIDKYFSQASILVNTSMFEAYPSYAIIQAWMNYAPVVSINDNSDEIMCKYNMGFQSKTLNQLIKDVRILLNNKALRDEMGLNGRKYVEREHSLYKIVKEYIKLFNNI